MLATLPALALVFFHLFRVGRDDAVAATVFPFLRGPFRIGTNGGLWIFTFLFGRAFASWMRHSEGCVWLN